MDTQVVVIGAGPAGLLLSQLLNRAGIATVILERASRAHVVARIRAGILEQGTVEVLHAAGVGARLAAQGIAHGGIVLSDGDERVHIDFAALTNKRVTVYGQTEITQDLFEAQDAFGTKILHGVEDVRLDNLDSPRPQVSYTLQGQRHALRCHYVVGCDGFHGVSRTTIPPERRRCFERVYPFGWLGILAATAPLHPELIYANSERGFALASMRGENLVRHYIQVPLSDRAEHWSDAQFWAEFQRRLPAEVAAKVVPAPSIEKSIAPLRSFVSEPLRWGRLFLAGDAAHIVPPTGAKGLNLAVSDIYYLHHALIEALQTGSEAGLEAYSDRALTRIWQAMRFSWAMTTMLHRFDGEDGFAAQMRRAALRHLAGSQTARKDLAENYVGLPY